MFRHPIWVVATVLACSAPPSAAALDCHERATVGQTEQQEQGQRGDQRDQKPPNDRRSEQRRWMWWRVAESRAELGITDQQSGEIDQIFQSTVPALRAAKDDVDKLDDEVAGVIKAATADEAAVSRLVGRAEHARARLTTTRTVMFYRMHRVLSAEQRGKLSAMVDRLEAERRKSSDSPVRR
jgi:Spy/CpxP family protein refolding chaperone